ncbi:MAG: hypothetical protein JWP15_1588 [Alphaproteobacteria bacterium]|nr:hypothetical protein [Alphaproteobacteria bacterium]
MIQLTPDCFNQICADMAVREQLGSLDDHRRAALRRFWLWIGGGLALGAAVVASLLASGNRGAESQSWLAIVIPILAIFLGTRGLSRVSGDLKRPVLGALATKAGLEYMADGFSPPVYPEARNALFGRLTREKFTDLFHGRDDKGLHLALYEADLTRSSGKSSHTVFKGQVYAIERQKTAGGTTVIVPDRSLFNFLKPMSGMERVKLDSDAEFENKFEVYSTSEMEARQLLFDSGLRARLLELRRLGRVFVFVGPDGALLAASTGKDRFEPGSMFSAKPGDERVRAMVEDVCAALLTLSEVKAALG